MASLAGIECFEAIGAAYRREVPLIGEGTPERVPAAWVSPDFLDLIDAGISRGRAFEPADFPGTDSVTLVSYAAWRRIWGRDPEIVGRTVLLDGRPVAIVGILNPEVRPPDIVFGNRIDFWLPLGSGGEYANDHGLHELDVVGRVRGDLSIAAAQAQVDATQEAFAREVRRNYVGSDGLTRTVPLVELREATVRDVGQTLWILLGAVGFMHLIACTNVANLFLARGTSRSREIALRGALGASRRRIAAQVLTEGVIVALLGGVVGVGLAYAGLEAFERYNPGGIPRVEGIGIDLRVLSFTVLLSAFTGILFGLLPALQATRRDANEVLKAGAVTVTASRSGMRVRGSLVVGQAALAVVLLIGAGLLFRTLVTMMSVDPGFEPERLVIVPLRLDAGYEEIDRRAFIDEIVPRIESVPGVNRVSGARFLPFYRTGSGYSGLRLMVCPDSGSPDGPRVVSMIHPVATGFFATLGVPIRYGRDFSAADIEDTAAVAIVNRGTAIRLFGEENVIGRTITLAPPRSGVDTLTVVGVVDGVRHWGLTREVEDDIYVPYAKFGTFQASFELLIQTDASVGAIAEPVRELIWSIDPDLPLQPAFTMEERISSSLATPRFLSMLFAAFAGVALLLSSSGVLSSLLYTVNERRREFGIRLALGAKSADLQGLVLRYGVRLSILGITLGIVLGLALTRLIQSMLWNVTPTDPTTFFGVALVLAASGAAASLVPAWNAARTDPLVTLRSD